jgi:RHS repeat-associated protein
LWTRTGPSDRLLTEKIGSAATTYTYGLGLIQQTPSGGSPHFYQHDGQRSTRQLTTAAGTVSDTYTYDAFGGQLNATGSTPNEYQYTGEQFDPSLGLYNLRSRYMSPSTGRFWSMDSYAGNAADPLSLHRYLYGNANPVFWVDPSGHGVMADLMASNFILGLLFTVARPALVGSSGIGPRRLA